MKFRRYLLLPLLLFLFLISYFLFPGSSQAAWLNLPWNTKPWNTTPWQTGPWNDPAYNQSNPVWAAGWFIADSNYSTGALSAWSNQVLLNSQNFNFTKLASDGRNLRLYKKSDGSYLAHARINISKANQTAELFFPDSNPDSQFDTIRYVIIDSTIAADSSNWTTTFLVGDDFSHNSYSTLPTGTIASLRVIVPQYSYEQINLDSVNSPKYWRVIRSVSDIVPTGSTKPFIAVISSSADTTANSYRPESTRVSLAWATDKNQLRWNKYSTPIFDIPASSAYGYKNPQLTISQSGDSVYAIFRFDSTGTSRDGIMITASIASNCTTGWTIPQLILQTNGQAWEATVDKPCLFYGPYDSPNNNYWQLAYTGITAAGRENIGLAYSTTGIRGPYTRWDGAGTAPIITANTSGTGYNSWDSTSTGTKSVLRYNGTVYIAEEGHTLANSSGIGGLIYKTCSYTTQTAANSGWTRLALPGELNNAIDRPVFSFCNDGTGDIAFLWQANGSSNRAMFKAHAADTAATLPARYTSPQPERGVGYPAGFANTQEKIIRHGNLEDSSGYLVQTPAVSLAHPVSTNGMTTLEVAADSFQSNIEIYWKSSHNAYDCPAGTGTVNYRVGLGYGQYEDVDGNSDPANESMKWYQSARDSSLILSIADTTQPANVAAGLNISTSTNISFNSSFTRPKAIATNDPAEIRGLTEHKLFIPSVNGKDSLIQYWRGGKLQIKTARDCEATALSYIRGTSSPKKRVFFSAEENSQGQGANYNLLDGLYIRNAERQGHEPITRVISDTTKLWRDTTLYFDYSNCTISDTRIQGATADRAKNEGGDTVLTAPFWVGTTDEYKILLHFDFLSRIPSNWQTVSVADDLWIKSTTYTGGGSTIVYAAESLEPWVQGTQINTYQSGSSSWVHKGFGSNNNIDGSSTTGQNRMWAGCDSSVGWGGGSHDRPQTPFGLTNPSSGSYMVMNTTEIVKHQIATRRNYGEFVLATPPTSGNRGLTLLSVECNAPARRPIRRWSGKYPAP